LNPVTLGNVLPAPMAKLKLKSNGMAQARLSSVSARSELFLEAVNLEFATGNLLRNQPPATALQSHDGHQ
jgi:hypothetical protein